MKRGRPTHSPIRQNIIEILFYLKKGYGYQIAKIYNEIFPTVTQRSIYYHLRKGVQLKEIVVHTIEQEEGNFSWGTIVEKIYYSIGENAQPRGEKRVEVFCKQFNRSGNRLTRLVGKFRKSK
ncbi:hypothetical protein HOL21_04210 [Candidatus Woesearchaeota archaeon]|jgi:hypothetical protein|nr:hypothetical protein [Candidatus Woesearchaeota archaeon]MBT5397390.1 hypothetical protein [Candidatus Woesearchaeota archaeon]MBT5924342.1 hypothetical protein [Candidatus Woesearchaeota archaeon]MBT6367764.1 hypothetical protein [Candidatus Woesearchaeota archaeon]MBT7762790.1 hypothetical protein [Candidatus Woesearchaeota archaeon]